MPKLEKQLIELTSDPEHGWKADRLRSLYSNIESMSASGPERFVLYLTYWAFFLTAEFKVPLLLMKEATDYSNNKEDPFDLNFVHDVVYHQEERRRAELVRHIIKGEQVALKDLLVYDGDPREYMGFYLNEVFLRTCDIPKNHFPNHNFAEMTDGQLDQLARDFWQPYLDAALAFVAANTSKPA